MGKHNGWIGFGLQMAVVVGIAIFGFLRWKTMEGTAAGMLLLLVFIGGALYIFLKGKFHMAGDIKKVQKEISQTLSKDEKLTKKLLVESRKKGMGDERFHEYMQGELAELDTKIQEKYRMLAHKKMAVCASLIHIFQNLEENGQQHALKDHHLKFGKTQAGMPIDNHHGQGRRNTVENAFRTLERLTSDKIMTEYFHVVGVQFSTGKMLKGGLEVEEKLVRAIRDVVVMQWRALKEAISGYDHQLKSNSAWLGNLHQAHIYGVINPLTKYYELAHEELKLTENLFQDELSQRKLAMQGKKLQ